MIDLNDLAKFVAGDIKEIFFAYRAELPPEDRGRFAHLLDAELNGMMEDARDYWASYLSLTDCFLSEAKEKFPELVIQHQNKLNDLRSNYKEKTEHA